MFSQQSEVDALCSATYLEDYLDGLESLPDEIQRHVSEIRRVDSEYFEAMKKIKQLKDSLSTYGVRAHEKASHFEGEAAPTNEIPPEQRRQKRALILKNMKYLLLQIQTIADYKLTELVSINELIESKTRQLEQDSKNMDLDINDDPGTSSKAVSSNHNNESASSQERSVRSIMRGFFRGDKERLSELSVQSSTEDNQVLRPDKSSIVSLTAAVLTTIASEAESEAASPSTTSSVTAVMDTATSRQAVKRPRRQKQFPDFVRTELDTPASLPALGGTNGSAAMSPSSSAPANSSASMALSTRSNKERTGSSGNVAQAAKRRKKRQKPEGTTSGGNGSGKIKFSVPVDPDEPIYCLCEQVSYGEMIGCDNNDCDIEWFHFNCVGLTSKPKGKWFCPNCRGDRPNIMKTAKN